MIFYVVELLDDWNVDVPSWKYPRNLESPRVSSPGFGNDSKMMVMRVDVTAQVTPELQCRMRTGIWQLLPKETDGAQHQTCLVSSLQLPRKVPVTTKRAPLNGYGGAGWLVWRGIILGSRTDLHVQSVTMTGHIYRDVILEQHVRLFRGAMGAKFLFMDDNARPHRANIVDECLQSEDITRMDWPAYSPDLNPIEHVWEMLGRRIAKRQSPPTCPPELPERLFNLFF
ncbi:transposable element Tcb2 transposase [Trichonephila clavipes]|nr:transposable element Tcb2 transposase [Trichonephila clavipes]